MNSQKEEMKAKLIDLEARSMRENLMFFWISRTPKIVNNL